MVWCGVLVREGANDAKRNVTQVKKASKECNAHDPFPTFFVEQQAPLKLKNYRCLPVDETFSATERGENTLSLIAIQRFIDRTLVSKVYANAEKMTESCTASHDDGGSLGS